MWQKLTSIVSIFGLFSVFYFSATLKTDSSNTGFCGQYVQSADNSANPDVQPNNATFANRSLDKTGIPRINIEIPDVFIFHSRVNIDPLVLSQGIYELPQGKKSDGFYNPENPPS
jgi:hypothetical protein